MNVKKRENESAWKEIVVDRRLIEGPNAESFAEKGKESQQKIKWDHRVISEERFEARARVEDKQKGANHSIERKIFGNDLSLQRDCWRKWKAY